MFSVNILPRALKSVISIEDVCPPLKYTKSQYFEGVYPLKLKGEAAP